MSLYRIADLVMDFEHEYSYIDRIAAPYRVRENMHVDLRIAPDKDDMRAEQKKSPASPLPYLESLSLLRGLAERLPDFDGFILHACVVKKGDRAYAFSAPSGTGKTTHARLWLDAFPDAFILNGDKPIVRAAENVFYAYGTPWCGKENLHINARAPLAGLCFLERSEQNHIEPFDPTDALNKLLSQIALPASPARLEKMLSLLDRFLKSVPIYRLSCNMLPEAAAVAFNGMNP